MHPLSVRSLPVYNACAWIMFSLCYRIIPYAVLRKGLYLISRASNLARSGRQGTARANALCMVVQKYETPDWRPESGDELGRCQIKAAIENS